MGPKMWCGLSPHLPLSPRAKISGLRIMDVRNKIMAALQQAREPTYFSKLFELHCMTLMVVAS